jgi:nucleolar protein 4
MEKPLPAQQEGKESRVVAVDFALSKEKWSEAQKQVEAEKPAKEDANDDESSSSGSSDDEDDSSEGEQGSEEAEDGGDDAAEEAEEEPVKPQLPAVDVGSTLFIRNLPFETTEEELGAL